MYRNRTIVLSVIWVQYLVGHNGPI